MAKDIESGVIDGGKAAEAESEDSEDSEDLEATLDDLSDDDLLDDGGLAAEIEDDLDVDEDDDLEDDDLADDEEVDVATDAVVVIPVASPVVEADEGSGDEDEDEIDDDDVEASLDVILKERLVVEDDEEDEDEDESADAEDRGDGNLRVLPKQPGEFVCRSCFLVKNESQLADEARMLCRDCV
jgi:Domain of unknown function (DUF4193)